MKRKQWSELSRGGRARIIVLTSIQVSLALSAWIDLARRDPAEIRGSKAVWGAVIAVNFVGPILYFTRGRIRR